LLIVKKCVYVVCIKDTLYYYYCFFYRNYINCMNYMTFCPFLETTHKAKIQNREVSQKGQKIILFIQFHKTKTKLIITIN